MRDILIDYIGPLFIGGILGAFITCVVMQFTDNLVVTFGAAFSVCLLFGFFIYPLIAEFLRG